MVFATGLFPDYFRLRNQSQATHKIWSYFKTGFAQAYQEYCESQITTPSAVIFYYQNMPVVEEEHQQDTIKSIDNLVTSTVVDQTAIAALTATNASLANNLFAVLKKVADLTQKLADLRAVKTSSGGGGAHL